MSVAEAISSVAPSQKELKRLANIAGDGLIVGWVIDLQEELTELVDQASEIQSMFDEVKESLNGGRGQLDPKSRSKIAQGLKRLIAFNNRSLKEMRAFEAIGLGDCVYAAEPQLKELRRAARLLKRVGRR